jgi:NitT/TauT family transport system substrate-binding protein
MKVAIEQNIVTPNVKRDGFGTVDVGRLDRSIEQVAASVGLARKPAAGEIFTDAFLPAKSDRMME